MERHCFRVLSDYHNLLRRWKRDYAPKTPEEEWHPLFVEALQKQSHVEYLLDVLLFSDIGERAALIASYGKEVRNLERRMADLAARTAAGRRTDTIQKPPPPRSVEEVKAMLESTEKGGVRNSIHNCLTVFQYDPVLSGAVAKNLLTERIDLLKPIGRKRRTGSKAMTDTDMKYIRLYLEDTYGLTSEKKIADAADLAADANSYHPIRDYLNGLVWDGKERIRYCLRHFLGADTDNFTFQSLRLFLLGAIHRAFLPRL